MPKRQEIKSVLIIGAGPIVIGQACEFDYSGTQACKALREEGIRVILINSNPATIMTDPSTAEAVYIEPITWQTVARIIEKERPCALLPTMGGQTALNCALDLDREGILEKFNVELIGASKEAINTAEDRQKFGKAMAEIGIDTARCGIAHSIDEALQVQSRLGFPAIIRPSFTLGGSGGGIAYNREEFVEICERGLDLSPTKELLIDESLIGWKEYEMEVVRDRNDNCIIICSIENLDPMGIHTGDSITVAPAQTLTDKEYQQMRQASIAVLRKVGVETGGSNVQFAINPADGRMVIIEMNPRVSRSSALASKATGFPIAKVAAKLAIGYTLDELRNDITGGKTPVSFEPSIDYVVTKIPRFTFEKFPCAEPILTTQMKSVGEVMAMGSTFQESFQKALRGLEMGYNGLTPQVDLFSPDVEQILTHQLTHCGPNRILIVADAMRFGWSNEKIFELTFIDPWFLTYIEDLVLEEKKIANQTLEDLSSDDLTRLKRKGFSDSRLAEILSVNESKVRAYRLQLGVKPAYKRVDTCGGEFSTDTAYMYSTYDAECEAMPTNRKKIVILGGGPNRIGLGIEFDYCCVHSALALREDGYETIMINCNPETVSTDYDTSDRLYFEPVTVEDVLSIIDKEKPVGVIVQFGGQTPLRIAQALKREGVPIIGTSPDAIDRAEDRALFKLVLEKLDLKQPPNRTVMSKDEAIASAKELTFPLVVRPSFVLGGRAMEIVYDEIELARYMTEAVKVSPESPILLDYFLSNAIEVDVDAVSDGSHVVIGAIMQHIEQAGIHSGDSACSLPPYSLSLEIQTRIREQMIHMALELGVVGLMNAQFAVQGEDVYVLEVNPRASRTAPFVSKCIGRSLAKIAARCMVGQSLSQQNFEHEIIPHFFSVKEAVFPFVKFPGVDPILGPEMRSTGEVMGVGLTFAEAFYKASVGAGEKFPAAGRVFISVKEADKQAVVQVARDLIALGFTLVATRGTAKIILDAGVSCDIVNKVKEGRPHIVDRIKNDEINLVINTTEGKLAIADSFLIRRSALQHKVTCTTTLAGAQAICLALAYMKSNDTSVRSIQSLHDEIA